MDQSLALQFDILKKENRVLREALQMRVDTFPPGPILIRCEKKAAMAIQKFIDFANKSSNKRVNAIFAEIDQKITMQQLKDVLKEMENEKN